jgi:hypothetical protein
MRIKNGECCFWFDSLEGRRMFSFFPKRLGHFWSPRWSKDGRCAKLAAHFT